MMDERPKPAGEKPRVEPEIIPPGGDDRQFRSGAARIRVLIDGGGIRNIHVSPLGPLGILVLALVIGLLLGIVLVLLLGVFVIWIPLLGLLIAAAIVSRLFRQYFRRRR